MSRVQLALNVSDLETAVDFYTKLFGSPPAKRHAGYANFAVAEPPLKLVLIENPGATERLNHIGVELFSTGEVTDEQARLAGVGLADKAAQEVTCCYAVQDKFWVHGPDSTPWELYTVLDDVDTMGLACETSPQPCCA